MNEVQPICPNKFSKVPIIRQYRHNLNHNLRPGHTFYHCMQDISTVYNFLPWIVALFNCIQVYLEKNAHRYVLKKVNCNLFLNICFFFFNQELHIKCLHNKITLTEGFFWKKRLETTQIRPWSVKQRIVLDYLVLGEALHWASLPECKFGTYVKIWTSIIINGECDFYITLLSLCRTCGIVMLTSQHPTHG